MCGKLLISSEILFLNVLPDEDSEEEEERNGMDRTIDSDYWFFYQSCVNEWDNNSFKDKKKLSLLTEAVLSNCLGNF